MRTGTNVGPTMRTVFLPIGAEQDVSRRQPVAAESASGRRPAGSAS